MRGLHGVSSHLPRPVFGFIDANNLKRSLEQRLDHLEIRQFAYRFEVSKLIKTPDCDRNYIFGAIRERDKDKHWLTEIQAQPRTIFLAETLTQKGGKTKEQGVDVRLAIEAMKCAHKGTMKSCLIFSSDGDLIPLVKALVDEGIVVTVVSFNDPTKGKVAPSLRNSADYYYQITNLDLLLLAGLMNSFFDNHVDEEEYGEFTKATIDTKFSDDFEFSQLNNGRVTCLKPLSTVPQQDGGFRHHLVNYSSIEDAEIILRLIGHKGPHDASLGLNSGAGP